MARSLEGRIARLTEALNLCPRHRAPLLCSQCDLEDDLSREEGAELDELYRLVGAWDGPDPVPQRRCPACHTPQVCPTCSDEQRAPTLHLDRLSPAQVDRLDALLGHCRWRPRRPNGTPRRSPSP